MIKTNAIVNSCMISKLIETGNGDIKVSGLINKDEKWSALTFQQGEEKEIGETDESIIGKTIDQEVPDTLIKFTKIESIDVIIYQLQLIREDFEKMMKE